MAIEVCQLHNTHRCFGPSNLLALLVSLIAATLTFAVGQESSVPPEWIRGGPALVEQSLRTCIQTGTPLSGFEADLVAEIAAINLLDLSIYFYDRPPLGMNDAAIQVLLANECDVLMGMPFLPAELAGVYPEHLEYSREYYRTGYILATRADSDIGTMQDLGPESRIGTLQTTAGDLQLTIYLQTVPENQRPRRVPYPSEELLYTRLQEGQLDAALFTRHFLAARTGSNLAAEGIHELSLPRRYNFEWGVGAAMTAGNMYLKMLVDESIAALLDYGFIDDLIEMHGLAGQAPD